MKKLVMLGMLLGIGTFAYANCGNDNGNGQGCSNSQGPTGPQGLAGLNGTDGTNGTNGVNGKDGKDGKNGSDAQVDNSAKLVLDTAIRLYDGKRVQVQAFNTYMLNRQESKDVIGDGRNMTFGARIVFKLGSSYEERMLEKQADQIKALESALSRIQN